MNKAELSKRYDYWIELKTKRLQDYAAGEQKHIERILSRNEQYLKTPLNAWFIPFHLHKESGHVYRTYFNIARSNITKSYDNLKNRVIEDINRGTESGLITRTEAAKLKRIYSQKIETCKQRDLSKFSSLDKKAQGIYKQSIKKLTQWGETGDLPPIERAVGWKYLPKGIREKAQKIQQPINARIAVHRKHLREIYKKKFGNKPIRYGSKEYREWREIQNREYRRWYNEKQKPFVANRHHAITIPTRPTRIPTRQIPTKRSRSICNYNQQNKTTRTVNIITRK